MYRYDLSGYSYGEAIPLDFNWVGFTYSGDGELHRPSAINKSSKEIGVSQYFKDDFIYLKFGPISRYGNGF